MNKVKDKDWLIGKLESHMYGYKPTEPGTDYYGDGFTDGLQLAINLADQLWEGWMAITPLLEKAPDERKEEI